MGQLITQARARAGLTIEGLSARVRLSKSFLHDVLHDRRPLDPRHWRRFAAALPVLTFRALALGSVVVGKVEVDASELTRGQRERLAAELERRARSPETRRPAKAG